MNSKVISQCLLSTLRDRVSVDNGLKRFENDKNTAAAETFRQASHSFISYSKNHTKKKKPKTSSVQYSDSLECFSCTCNSNGRSAAGNLRHRCRTRRRGACDEVATAAPVRVADVSSRPRWKPRRRRTAGPRIAFPTTMTAPDDHRRRRRLDHRVAERTWLANKTNKTRTRRRNAVATVEPTRARGGGDDNERRRYVRQDTKQQPH